MSEHPACAATTDSRGQGSVNRRLELENAILRAGFSAAMEQLAGPVGEVKQQAIMAACLVVDRSGKREGA